VSSKRSLRCDGLRFLMGDRKKHVQDEYEIDPEQNEGASFAFHDVKRRKADRRHMHGGDCECCKDVSGVCCRRRYFALR
jgi:hypothetical protein